ncbi:hypothetical protein ACFX2J_014684 [Malus domestica]
MLHETTCPQTPPQNGVAELKNRHILETTQALLIGAHVPHAYWVDAVMYSVYLLNRMPSQVHNFRTPMEVLTDYVTLPSSLQLSPCIFGCVAYVHLHKNQRSKLDMCVVRCVFLGFNSQQKGYRCYHPSTKHFYVTMDVTFSETDMFFISVQTHCTLQEELNSKYEDYSWFDVPHERGNWHGPSSTAQTETKDLGVMSNPPDRALPEGRDTSIQSPIVGHEISVQSLVVANDITSQSLVDLDRETPDREIAHAVSN